ncbi:hypothetical protein FACS1894190_13780 [Spirochaetia bacterium]|nr:hypothetical protein FACS1894190_13780 [Spirochaetia bacterium]
MKKAWYNTDMGVKLKLSTISALLLFVLPLYPQMDRKILQFEPLAVHGASTEESRLIENLLKSYFDDHKEVLTLHSGIKYEKLAPVAADDIPDVVSIAMPEQAPDYFVSSTLEQKDGLYTLELVVRNSLQQPVFNHVSSYKSTGEMALSLRSVVDNAVLQREVPTIHDNDTPLVLTSENILGLWRGDTNVELVRILPGGKAFAFLKSGKNMQLTYAIENNILSLIQKSPNDERFYSPQPPPVAKKLAEQAEPLRWDLNLFENGSTLRGTRSETTAEYETYDNIRLLPGSTSTVAWSRMQR